MEGRVGLVDRREAVQGLEARKQRRFTPCFFAYCFRSSLEAAQNGEAAPVPPKESQFP